MANHVLTFHQEAAASTFIADDDIDQVAAPIKSARQRKSWRHPSSSSYTTIAPVYCLLLTSGKEMTYDLEWCAGRGRRGSTGAGAECVAWDIPSVRMAAHAHVSNK